MIHAVKRRRRETTWAFARLTSGEASFEDTDVSCGCSVGLLSCTGGVLAPGVVSSVLFPADDTGGSSVAMAGARCYGRGTAGI